MSRCYLPSGQVRRAEKACAVAYDRASRQEALRKHCLKGCQGGLLKAQGCAVHADAVLKLTLGAVAGEISECGIGAAKDA